MKSWKEVETYYCSLCVRYFLPWYCQDYSSHGSEHKWIVPRAMRSLLKLFAPVLLSRFPFNLMQTSRRRKPNSLRMNWKSTWGCWLVKSDLNLKFFPTNRFQLSWRTTSVAAIEQTRLSTHWPMMQPVIMSLSPWPTRTSRWVTKTKSIGAFWD